MIKHIIAICLILVSLQTAQAQSIQKEVVASSGKVLTAGGYKMNYTFGEMSVLKLITASGGIAQGFQPFFLVNNPLPITGLEFYAQRLSPSSVQLQWQTLTEINNKGFYVERKLENELDFNQQNFVVSIADQGNSEVPLQYQYTDTNNFSGRTYYRIKQEDIDGNNSYSLIRIVYGEQANQLSLQIWPVPSTGFINVQLLGSDKTHEIDLLDAQGKMIKNIKVENQQAYRIEGLIPGIYFVNLKSDKHITQKIVVE